VTGRDTSNWIARPATAAARFGASATRATGAATTIGVGAVGGAMERVILARGVAAAMVRAPCAESAPNARGQDGIALGPTLKSSDGGSAKTEPTVNGWSASLRGPR